MKHHEREFFISLIRSGKTYIHYDNLELVIRPLTIEQNIRACQFYNEVYEQAYIDGMMDKEETELWMKEQGLWTYEDDEKVKGLEKDIERLKVEIFNAKNNEQLKERIRMYIRAGEKQLNEQLVKQNQYFGNTCEGIATTEKTSYIIRNTTFLNEKLYDFDDVSLSYVINEWQESLLSEKQCRELARTEPWKSLWIIKDNARIKLFENTEGFELTYNQKNILIWSQMYDNIQESLDCPTVDVINDDDMLDGWFIIQGKKREKEKAEKEFEETTKNSKIKNASEVFIMSNNSNDRDKINNMNDIHGSNIKKQREALIKKKGVVSQNEFFDEKLRVQTEATNKFKGHVRGGR